MSKIIQVDGIKPHQPIPHVGANYGVQYHGLIVGATILMLAILSVLAFWGDPTLPKHDLPTIIPILIALGLFLWFSARDLKEDRLTRRWFVLLFSVHLVVALSVNLVWWWPNAGYIGGDKYLYEQLGWGLVNDGFSFRSIVSFTVQDIGATIYVAIIYAFFGHNPAAVAVINTLIVSLTGLQVYRLAGRYVGVRSARRAVVLWVLLPASLFLSSYPSKEILVSFLGIFITNQVADMLDRIGKLKPGSFWPHLGLVVISLIVFLTIRSMMVIPLITIVLMQFWFQRKMFSNIKSSISFLVVLVVFLNKKHNKLRVRFLVILLNL